MLWLWHRLAAVALIRPLAWELPYAVGVALRRQKEIKYFKKLVQEAWNSSKVVAVAPAQTEVTT